jgi:uncharacterized protein YyaL (SSP411 family)
MWLVPHFEKMLYDQALLVPIYIETYQATKKKFYLDTADEILTYVMRDMTSQEGGFYSAEDADSEGVEGKFYVWTEHDILVPAGRDARIVLNYYNVKPDGNWSDPLSEESIKTNILHLTKMPEEFSAEINLPLTDFKEKFRLLRGKLYEKRERRTHPFKDNKILTDWNGLMISAFVKTAQVTGNENYISFARTAADFINDNLTEESGDLLHRYRDGDAAVKGNLDDYAFFIQAMLDLYETTFAVDYLTKAKDLLDDAIKKFQDNEDGGFFFSSIGNNELIINQKDIYDGALPSGNSVMMLNLLRIEKMTGDESYGKNTAMLIRAFSDSISKSPSAYTQALTGLDFAFGPSFEIVVSSPEYDHSAVQMINEIREIYLPDKIILLRTDSNNLEKLAPYTAEQKPVNGRAAVYICRNFSCEYPVSDPGLLKDVLR